MCGRYTVVRLSQIAQVIHNVTIKVDLAAEMARWNVAPSQEVPILTQRNTPTLEKARWGLVPSWAKDPSIGQRLLYARAETVREKPAYRAAFQARRCAIPTDGFYEWRRNGDGTKTPFFIRLKSRESFAFAGLWESWIDPAGEALTTCAIIMTAPNALIAPIHDRMPVMMRLDQVSAWIGGTSREAEALLRPMPAEALEAYSVSTRVNSAEIEGPQLIEPVEEWGRLF